MTAIEITTETPTEMYCLLNLIKKMEARDSEPVRPVQKARILPDQMPTASGLGKESEEEAEKKAEQIIGKLIEDLRAYAEFIDGMPRPADMQRDLLLAARVIEILWRNRELHQTVSFGEGEQICEARG